LFTSDLILERVLSKVVLKTPIVPPVSKLVAAYPGEGVK